jgi:uncharacterized protein (TIGR03118 family)
LAPRSTSRTEAGLDGAGKTIAITTTKGEVVSTGFAARLSLLSLAVNLSTISYAATQNTTYRQTNLVSDVSGVAAHLDHGLVNPWGIALSGPGIELSPAGSLWVSNNGTGLVTAYDNQGEKQLTNRVSGLPSIAANSRPAGIVHNTTETFNLGGRGALPSPFLFAAEDGTISGWYADRNGDILEGTVLAVDNSKENAVYTGLAILTPGCCNPILAAANFEGGDIETYTGFFDLLGINHPVPFIDPKLPAHYAPFNISVVGNEVFVTYALQNAARSAPVTGAGNGIVDIYDLDGHFIKRFASNGELNAPWGVVKASAGFGEFSNDILIANFGDGTINAFNPITGAFVGQLKNSAGKAIVNSGLRGLEFGAPGSPDANTLYFTAGLSSGLHGLFGAISVNSAPTSEDFSVAASAQDVSVKAGDAARFELTATPAGGFQGNIAFSCMAPTGISCKFDSANISAASGEGTTTLTVATPARSSSGPASPRTETVLVTAESGETTHTTVLSVTVE